MEEALTQPEETNVEEIGLLTKPVQRVIQPDISSQLPENRG